MENPARVGVERPVARWQEHALFNSVKERCGRTRTSKKGLTGPNLCEGLPLEWHTGTPPCSTV